MSSIDTQNNKPDDEIDEEFISSKTSNPVLIENPSPLSNEELQKLNEMIKNKSNKELLDYVTELVMLNTPGSYVEKIQMRHNIAKMYSGNSKKMLIEVITKFINQKNKYVIFTDSSELKTVTEESLTREELRAKLRNKIGSSNKNSQKMYEQLQEQLSQNPELSDMLNQNQNKKKKKLDPRKLQQQLINQMANLMKNSPNNNPTPNSA
jgi:hypothetical protein